MAAIAAGVRVEDLRQGTITVDGAKRALSEFVRPMQAAAARLMGREQPAANAADDDAADASQPDSLLDRLRRETRDLFIGSFRFCSLFPDSLFNSTLSWVSAVAREAAAAGAAAAAEEAQRLSAAAAAAALEAERAGMRRSQRLAAETAEAGVVREAADADGRQAAQQAAELSVALSRVEHLGTHHQVTQYLTAALDSALQLHSAPLQLQLWL